MSGNVRRRHAAAAYEPDRGGGGGTCLCTYVCANTFANNKIIIRYYCAQLPLATLVANIFLLRLSSAP